MIPQLFGHDIDEWAWWNANWLNYKNTTIHGDSVAHPNDFHCFNLTGLTLGTNNCTKEPRAISDTGIELDFIVTNDENRAAGDGKESCEVCVNYSVDANTNNNISWYYNYALATIPAYMDEELDFPAGSGGWMGGRFIPDGGGGYGWTHIVGTHGSNITVPEEGNRWHLYMNQGAEKGRWESVALQTNITVVLRVNNSNADADDDMFVYIGNSTHYDHIRFSPTTIGSWQGGASFGTNGSLISTYRVTWTTGNFTVWKYNNSDGSAFYMGTVSGAETVGGVNVGFGDGTNGEAYTAYYDFIGYNLAGAYDALPFTLGTEQSPTVPATPLNVTLYLNGTRGNYSYLNQSIANFTVVGNVTSLVNLTSNQSGFVTQSSMYPLFNYTTIICPANNTEYNITGYTGNSSWTFSQEDHFALCYVTTTTTTIAPPTTTTLVDYCQLMFIESCAGRKLANDNWCIDNITLARNLTYRITTDLNVTNITVYTTEECRFGCDNVTNVCSPSPTELNVWIFVAIFMIIILAGFAMRLMR